MTQGQILFEHMGTILLLVFGSLGVAMFFGEKALYYLLLIIFIGQVFKIMRINGGV